MDSIQISKLTKGYGSLIAVNKITFNVKQGEIFGMLGPNGAGKTTTIEMIVGLRQPDQGTISVLDLDPTEQKNKMSRLIGVQLQTTAIFPRLTVMETLRLFASFFSDPLPAEKILEWIGLEEKANNISSKLSGGQLQRLAVGTAIIGNGKIVFLDEPTTGLDPQARHNLWDVFLRLRKLGKTIFLTTHYMEEAQRLCDRVAIIDHGSIIALDSPDQLINDNFLEQAIEVASGPEVDTAKYQQIPGVKRIQISSEKVTLYSSQVEETIRFLINNENEGGPGVTDLSIRKATLEDVFLKLTGRSIRE